MSPDNVNQTIEKKFSLAIESFENNSIKEAQILFEEILKIDPNHAETYYNLGLIFQRLREFNKSKNFYKKAIKIKPSYIEAHNNLGLIFRELNDLKNAKLSYQKAIDIDPNSIMAIFNLGIIFRELGEFKSAIKCYEKVIKIQPNLVKAYNNIGNVFKKMGENNKAISHFENALKLNPNSVEAQVNISNVYISQLNDINTAVQSSYKALKIFQQKVEFRNQSISLYRLKHDLQQANYLYSKNYKIDGINEFIKIGSEILKRDENKDENNDSYKKINLKNNEVNSLLPFYKANYIYQTQDITTGCINSSKNWKDIEDEYFNSNKQIIYIDDFLSDKTIRELQNFCLVSKIWIEERRNKYLGSFSDKGFISPLHLKIAIELKNKLPNLFGKHRLGRFWGFKYDSVLGKGINIHADFALVNLNFWITPDMFNNDQNRGGLKIYDTPAPEDWTFQKYNMNADEIYALLKKNKANCVNVPYKFNRAVLFNSDYFHETDQINFKDEYEGRRINITYLFGDRLFKNESQ
jgi:tetratricopeptide (TPR) repeat protein